MPKYDAEEEVVDFGNDKSIVIDDKLIVFFSFCRLKPFAQINDIRLSLSLGGSLTNSPSS